ncbi:MAG: hypothetical protein WCJ56_11225 [bacterium]
MRAAILLVMVLMMAVLGAAQTTRPGTPITVIPTSMTSEPGIDFRGSDAILLANAIMRKARDTNSLYPAYSMPLYDNRTTKVITATQTFELLSRTLIAWYDNGVCPDKVTVTIPSIAPPGLQPLLEPAIDGDTHAVRSEEIYACITKMLATIIPRTKMLPDSFVLGRSVQTQYKFTTAQLIVAMAAVLQNANESLELPRTVETPLVKSPNIWNALDNPLPIKRRHTYVSARPTPSPIHHLEFRDRVLPATDENLPDSKTWPRPRQLMPPVAVPVQSRLNVVYNWIQEFPDTFTLDAGDITNNRSNPPRIHQALNYDEVGASLSIPIHQITSSITPLFYPLWRPAAPVQIDLVTPDAPVVQLPPIRVTTAQVKPATADMTVLLNGVEVTRPEQESNWLSELYSGKISVEIRPQGDFNVGMIRIDNAVWLITSGPMVAGYNTQLIDDGWHSMVISTIDKSGRGIIHTVYFQVRNGRMSSHIARPETIVDGI